MDKHFGLTGKEGHTLKKLKNIKGMDAIYAILPPRKTVARLVFLIVSLMLILKALYWAGIVVSQDSLLGEVIILFVILLGGVFF